MQSITKNVDLRVCCANMSQQKSIYVLELVLNAK